MVKSFFVMCVVLFAFAVRVNGAPFQDRGDPAEQDPRQDVPMDIDWNKVFDASVETDPKRRMLVRQYAALRPLTDKIRELFVHERVSVISIYHLRIRQLKIRWQLEEDPREKKKCLKVLVHHLKQIQDSSLLMMERPVHAGGDSLERKDIDNLVDSTLEIVKWEMKLEQLNETMAAEKKQ